MKLFKNQTFVLLALIIFLGFILRVFNISHNPVALYGDELTIAYDAFSLLKTGHDQTGEAFPLTFRMGEGRSAGYVYGSIPFIALFGPTEIGVRSLSVLSGMGIIILVFLLSRFLFNSNVALVAATLISINPWALNLSRGGFEANFGLFLMLLAAYLLVLASKKGWLYILSALFFGLAIHTYPTYKLTIPLFLILFLYSFGVKRTKYAVLGLIVLLAFTFVSVHQTLNAESDARFLKINIFNEDYIKSQVKLSVAEQREFTTLIDPEMSYFHNQYIQYMYIFTGKYLANFAPDFLFISGDKNPVHNMTTGGVFYLIEIVTIILGVMAGYRFSKQSSIFILGWVGLAAIPTAIVGDPHSLRSSLMLPGLVILSAMGIVFLYERKSKFLAAISTVIVILIFFNFIIIVERLFFVSPYQYFKFWSLPAKSISHYVNQRKGEYDWVILSDRIDNLEHAYPLYNKIDPEEVVYQRKNPTILSNSKVYIGFVQEDSLKQFLNSMKGKGLYIGLKKETDLLENYTFFDVYTEKFIRKTFDN